MTTEPTDTDAVNVVEHVPLKHEITATVLATIASFVAGKIVNQAYTKYIVKRGTQVVVETVPAKK